MKMLFLLLACICVAAPLSAQGWIEPGRPGAVVERTRSEVSVRVNGRIAQVEVREWFTNRGGAMAEGDYLYPLPGEAVFGSFSLFQGEEELRGESMDAERARAIYEEIVRRKRDPALIELVGHGLLRARVFPINAGETRRIIMRYTQVLGAAGDGYELRYAAPQQPRTRGGEAGREPAQGTGITLDIDVLNADSIRTPFSPTQDVRAQRVSDRWHVRASNVRGAFTLVLPSARSRVGLNVLTHKPSGEDGYFMLALTPGEVAQTRIPRDVTIVVDVSGSMGGRKMEQARQAMQQLLTSLRANDRFRMIAFNGAVHTFENEFVAATAQQVREARAWVEQLTPEGGTNIADALEEAFRERTPDGRLGIVVFMTDGLPSVGEQNPERIAAQAESSRGNARVFAFGVGYDVNTYLLDRLSAAGRGTTQYVGPDENVERALGLLAARIRNPVLTDLELRRPGVRISDVYPRSLPDLFSGEELIVLGRYTARTDVRSPVTIRGRRGASTEEFTTEVVFPAHQRANDYLPRLWASRKVGFLSQQIRLNGATPEVVEDLRQTALRYGIISEYTSYLVQERDLMADGRRDMLPPPPPSAPVVGNATGAAAVSAARESALQRAAKSAADVAEAPAAAVRAERRAGVRTVRIEPFSAAYFAVLRELPEIRRVWKSQTEATAAGRRVELVVGRGGVSALTREELARLVADYTGA